MKLFDKIGKKTSKKGVKPVDNYIETATGKTCWVCGRCKIFFKGDKPEFCPECGVKIDWGK